MALKKLKLTDITKRFFKKVVLDSVTFEINSGEMFFLLGPSGCGKSTLLRIIAGLEVEDSGTIEFDGQMWGGIPPEKRAVGMVFQQYSLWPHMSVAENVGYSLKIAKLLKRDRTAKVEKALELVGLSGYGERMPGTLSGGEQQRVALARALAQEASIILLDEPLSNIDAMLRTELRTQIRKLQQSLNLTMIYVTHDQEEAMTMADRIAILNNGIIEEIGTPSEIFNTPSTPFAATFFGKSSLVPVDCVGYTSKGVEVSVGNVVLNVNTRVYGMENNAHKYFLVVKPNAVVAEPLIGNSKIETPFISGMVFLSEYHGFNRLLSVRTDYGDIKVFAPDSSVLNRNSAVRLHFIEEKLSVVAQ